MLCCSLGGPLSYSSPVVVFFDRGHPCFRNFNSTIPVDVIRVKSYVNCLFDPAYFVRQTKKNSLLLYSTTMNNHNIFYDINKGSVLGVSSAVKIK